jgi:hypothetical protein
MICVTATPKGSVAMPADDFLPHHRDRFAGSAARRPVDPAFVTGEAPAKRKQFFFEKKNQKTLACWHPTVSASRPNFQKFFASFFQKRRACLPLSPKSH